MTKVTWHCPECGGQNVQSPEWCQWNVTTQQWESSGDSAGDEYWCEDCEAHNKSLEERTLEQPKEEGEDGHA